MTRGLAALGLGLCLAVGPSIEARCESRDDWLGRDKASHFSVSLALAVGGYEGGAVFSGRPAVRLTTGAVVSLSAGLVKEMADRRNGGDPSARDFTWDVIGAATGLAIAWLIDTYAFRTRARTEGGRR